MINTALLAEICEIAGAPGHEQRVREIVLREVESLVDEIKIDNMGNVVAIKKGKESKKVMILLFIQKYNHCIHIRCKYYNPLQIQDYFYMLGKDDPP